MNFNLILIGSGTSNGIPRMGCTCKVCTSNDTRDQKMRSASWLTNYIDTSILIDCGADIREQCLTSQIRNINGILNTHEHYDHIDGLPDLIPYTIDKKLNLYCHSITTKIIKEKFLIILILILIPIS
jgi:phosphoribosyl 1,2-cyclic phosphate phosphodiesterase